MPGCGHSAGCACWGRAWLPLASASMPAAVATKVPYGRLERRRGVAHRVLAGWLVASMYHRRCPTVRSWLNGLHERASDTEGIPRAIGCPSKGSAVGESPGDAPHTRFKSLCHTTQRKGGSLTCQGDTTATKGAASLSCSTDNTLRRRKAVDFVPTKPPTQLVPQLYNASAATRCEGCTHTRTRTDAASSTMKLGLTSVPRAGAQAAHTTATTG